MGEDTQVDRDPIKSLDSTAPTQRTTEEVAVGRTILIPKESPDPYNPNLYIDGGTTVTIGREITLNAGQTNEPGLQDKLSAQNARRELEAASKNRRLVTLQSPLDGDPFSQLPREALTISYVPGAIDTSMRVVVDPHKTTGLVVLGKNPSLLKPIDWDLRTVGDERQPNINRGIWIPVNDKHAVELAIHDHNLTGSLGLDVHLRPRQVYDNLHQQALKAPSQAETTVRTSSQS